MVDRKAKPVSRLTMPQEPDFNSTIKESRSLRSQKVRATLSITHARKDFLSSTHLQIENPRDSQAITNGWRYLVKNKKITPYAMPNLINLIEISSLKVQ